MNIHSLQVVQDRNKAVDHIVRGDVIIVQVHGVFGLMADAGNDTAIDTISRIKHEKSGRTFSTFLKSKELKELIDPELVHPELISLIPFLHHIAPAMFHIRIPIKDHCIKKLPKHIISTKQRKLYIQTLDPSGEPLSSITTELRRIQTYCAITTLNRHGEPEITTKEGAYEYWQEHKNLISMMLVDDEFPKDRFPGSFVILDFEKKQAIRNGHIPVHIIEMMMDIEFDKSRMKDVVHPIDSFKTVIEYMKHERIPKRKREYIRKYIESAIR